VLVTVWESVKVIQIKWWHFVVDKCADVGMKMLWCYEDTFMYLSYVTQKCLCG